MRTRSSMRAGWLNEVPGAQQHGAEDLGIVEVAGDRLGPAGQLERLVDVDEQPVRRRGRPAAGRGPRSASSPSAARAASVTARPSRHRVDEPDGAELRDGGGGADERRRCRPASLRPLGGVEQHRQALRVAAVVQRGADADRQVERRAAGRADRGARAASRPRR